MGDFGCGDFGCGDFWCGAGAGGSFFTNGAPIEPGGVDDLGISIRAGHLPVQVTGDAALSPVWTSSVGNFLEVSGPCSTCVLGGLDSLTAIPGDMDLLSASISFAYECEDPAAEARGDSPFGVLGNLDHLEDKGDDDGLLSVWLSVFCRRTSDVNTSCLVSQS